MSARATIHFFILLAAVLWACESRAQAAAEPFGLEETTIDDIHRGIRSGEVTCEQIVQGYVDRARAYNGVCTTLVTADGAPAPAVPGTVRAGVPLTFPTETIAISKVVPDFDRYKGSAPDFGRMEPTMSDPDVQQQFGMVVGIPNAGQVNALETLNIRGERSVTCKGAFDAHPSTGSLPPDAPAVCEEFRKQPDALERAAELDARYGRNPDLEAMPLYCAAMAFKAVYDTKDMRSTGGGDVAYAMDAAPADSTLVSRVRDAGAIIFAKAHNSEYNGGSGNPGGDAEVERPLLGTGGSRETWGGATCNPYDTERETGGSSGGSGVSVAANLVVCSICESTGGSCRNPGTHNGVVTFVPMKGMISYGGGIGADPYRDRPGIQCRTVEDAAKVFEAFRHPETGFFDARDPYTALTRPVTSETSYLSALSDPAADKPLAGMRIGVLRELMAKETPSHAAIIDAIDAELEVLASLGAELVESTSPGYDDDPAIPNMELTFENAMAEIIPFHMPEVFSWKNADGEPEFEVPGYDVTSREYLVGAAALQAPWPANLDFGRIFGNAPETEDTVSGYTFSFQLAQYLLQRGDTNVYDWKTLNENAKYFSDVRRAAMQNWENKPIDVRTNDGTFTMKRRDVMRMVVLKVMEQNEIDVFVNPPLINLPNKIGGPRDPSRGSGHGYGARLGIPEVFVPAGFADTIYEPTFVLSEDGTEYDTVAGTTPTKLASPLPFNIAFWAAQGEEAAVLKVASAYEAATRHRKPPPGFGPVATMDERISSTDR
jgi:Asp-tRNA(Asn)/Glu-tRNA(Gln) amidotransferase A subunit family amidase